MKTAKNTVVLLQDEQDGEIIGAIKITGLQNQAEVQQAITTIQHQYFKDYEEGKYDDMNSYMEGLVEVINEKLGKELNIDNRSVEPVYCFYGFV